MWIKTAGWATFAVVMTSCRSRPEAAISATNFDVVAASDGQREWMSGVVRECLSDVETYFHHPMPEQFGVQVYDTHLEMEQAAQQKWSVGELPCWAVAMGSGSGLMIIDPQHWPREACEHADDTEEDVRGIIRHELVHVYHGQRNADHEFMQSDDIGWFVEGVAVLASRQFTEARHQQARREALEGREPAQLTEAWSGPARYAVAGSMAAFVEQRVRREGLCGLLGARDNATILSAAGFADEDEFLEAWTEWVKK